MNESDETDVRRDWMLLLDSDEPDEEPTQAPAVETIVGGWLVEDDGTIGRFESNPLYQPRNPDSPTSAVDAAVKLVATDRADVGLVLRTLRDSLVMVALDETGDVAVATAPDGVACVVVASGALDQSRVDAPQWRQVDLAELVRLLPDGLDVLVNPGGPRSMRLLADALRESVDANGAE
ncbi:type VII secretion system-associated protein [Verrucosispora sp. WMMC514]|uniref:type VII secretion system-associated protein n=1 Tax=Verrucosispora sp. WMMC514 TaxID=3015156 RepID=UPI00248AC540|nr:type VII secretion system-associated protein [Verrucosispora sp. WMMC514]WBB89953.1 type VII secretion system-associated protein [Verrucosispora sp. WMMC514]